MKVLSNFFTKIVNRWLPDAFLFAIILTLVVFVAALLVTDNTPIDMLVYWGSDTGFWGLLSFTMQMCLVVVLGTALASAKVCKDILRKIASIASSNKSAILLVTFVSTICCWLNWGFGLVAGALLAKEIARRVPTVDYRLLIASAYSGFVIWHAGLSGSIPLTIAQPTEIGGVTFSVPISQTIFHPMNLIMVGVILVLMPFVNWAMHPDKEHTVCVDVSLLTDEEERTYEVKCPADRIEQSRILWILTMVMGFGYIIYYFFTNGFNLGLNIVNMIFMFLGILAHGSLRRYVDAIGDASTTAAGVLMQFPFYAGIMGMMVGADANGNSLGSVITDVMMAASTNVTFPMLTFLSAGVVNFFVPSGGGQWAVQGPIVMPAAEKMGIELGRAAMGIAWGDQWTNMIQPFWALPALGIAGLQARDIMGYLVIVTIFVGIVACLGFLVWAMV
ncbi:MAG: short-chain fatty acid transporter [Clostridiales bacterium]|nr:short-chain fatty acid transporter [bacterium 210917-SL.2.15]MCI5843685.1 short-chain fatty acid transporter [Clostridiales bacterium]MDY4037444.1 short-chain fatty acid transporter [Candidatus Pseudoscilispira sp.]